MGNRGAELLGVWKDAMKSSSVSVNPELACNTRRESQDPLLWGGVGEVASVRNQRFVDQQEPHSSQTNAPQPNFNGCKCSFRCSCDVNLQTKPSVLAAQGFSFPSFDSVPQYLLPQYSKASKGIQAAAAAAAAMASAKFAFSSGSSQTRENITKRKSRVPSLPPSMMNSQPRDHYMMDVEFNNLSMAQSSSRKQEMPADLEAIEAWIDADFGKSLAQGGSYMMEADVDSYEKMLKQMDIEEDSDTSSVLYNVYQYPTFESSLEVYNYDTISYVEDLWSFS